jgi:cap1 methyltransferase
VEPITGKQQDVQRDLINLGVYQDVTRIHSELRKQPSYETLKTERNPFENIGPSFFMDRAGIKLANIDAVFGITKTDIAVGRNLDTNDFIFCDIAGGPGAFTQYLQYRRAAAKGYGITLQSPIDSLAWKTQLIDMDRFKPLYGPSGTGNLYTETPAIINEILASQTQGVDLAVADGGFEVDFGAEIESSGPVSAARRVSSQPRRRVVPDKDDIDTSRLVIAEIYLALSILKDGADFVIKLFNTATKFYADIIYALSRCFDRIHIIKPITSRPLSDERYLIGKTFKRDNDVVQLFASLFNRGNVMFTSIFTQALPSKFLSWLKSINDAIIAHKKAAIDIFRTNRPPRYDTHLPIILWSIPGNSKTIAA